MALLYISGSPRKHSNTDYLLRVALKMTGGEIIKLEDYKVEPCRACRDCRGSGECILEDDMAKEIIPRLLASSGIILGSPVYYNNVSAQLKCFIDRTHCLMGMLRNKIGGAVVVGRRYGAESAITAINAFFTKHEMIVANRGVAGIAFKPGEVEADEEAVRSAKKLATRLLELQRILKVDEETVVQ